MIRIKTAVIAVFAFLAISIALAGAEPMSAIRAAESFKRDDDESIYHDKES